LLGISNPHEKKGSLLEDHHTRELKNGGAFDKGNVVICIGGDKGLGMDCPWIPWVKGVRVHPEEQRLWRRVMGSGWHIRT